MRVSIGMSRFIERELENTIVKYRHLPLLIDYRRSFSCTCSVSYGCLYVFSMCVVNVWVLMHSIGVCLISELKVFEASHQKGVTER